MKYREIILFITKNNIYIFKDTEESISSFENLELELSDVLDGIELDKNDKIYIFLDLYYFNQYKRKFILNEEIKKIVEDILKKFKFSIYLISYVDILIEKNYGKNIMVIEDDRSYDFLFQNNKYDFKIINFKREDCEKDQIFDDYIIYLSENEIFDCIKEYKNFNKLKKIKIKSIFNEKYLIYFAIIFSLLTYYFTAYFFNVNGFILKIGRLNEDINFIKSELEDKKEEVKSVGVIEILKKPIYLDIDFYINMTKYGIKYTDISYKEKKWYLKGVAENLKILDNFNAKIEKLNKNIKILSLTDNEDGIKFEYVIEDMRV